MVETNKELLQKIDQWAEEGLISNEQALALRARVAAEGEGAAQQNVQGTEILVYLGSLIVFLALAFLAVLNWEELGSAGRILILLLPALAMFALGWPLRSASSARRRRGAQALWLGASLVTGVLFMVTSHELDLIDWQNRGPTEIYFTLSCLLAGGIAGIAYLLLPTVVQSVPFHFWLSAAFLSFLGWLGVEFQPVSLWVFLVLGLLMGALWLALSAWLNRRGQDRLAAVSLLVGAVTALATPFLLSPSNFDATWQRTAMELISLATCLIAIAASVRLQSRILLYSGAIFLLLFITYVNFEHFADEVGMPIALFLSGATLIALGLGTGRLSERMGRHAPAG